MKLELVNLLFVTGDEWQGGWDHNLIELFSLGETLFVHCKRDTLNKKNFRANILRNLLARSTSV